MVSHNYRKPQNRLKPGVDLAAQPRYISFWQIRDCIADQVPLTEEEWQEIPQPFLYLIRLFHIPLWG